MAVHGPDEGPGQNPAYRPPDALLLNPNGCALSDNKRRPSPTPGCDSEERKKDIHPIALDDR